MLVDFLRANADMFACSPSDMPSITREAAEHSLEIRAGVDIWERNKELIRKRTDIGEHFTREVIQSIIIIFLPLGQRVHLTNRSITTNPLGNKECLSI